MESSSEPLPAIPDIPKPDATTNQVVKWLGLVSEQLTYTSESDEPVLAFHISSGIMASPPRKYDTQNSFPPAEDFAQLLNISLDEDHECQEGHHHASEQPKVMEKLPIDQFFR